MDWAGRIKQRLNELGISQTDAARKADISRHKLSKFLSGKRLMRSDTLERLADELGMDLLTDPEPPSPLIPHPRGKATTTPVFPATPQFRR